jgi:hypothetical protein
MELAFYNFGQKIKGGSNSGSEPTQQANKRE